jgi:FG-GAP-like repeat
VDFDGDGTNDLVSGSYDPGTFHWFAGRGKAAFGPVQTICDRSSKPVLRQPDQKEDYESFGSFLDVFDWDADGDLDLVCGGFGGEVFLRRNDGTRTAPEYEVMNEWIEAGGAQLIVPGHHATPICADWDGDGLFDILSGSEKAAVWFYRNVGARNEPAFAAGVELIPPHVGVGYREFLDVGAEPTPGVRFQIDVADFDADGKLDLLVGDFQTNVTPRADLTADERTAMFAAKTELDRVDGELAPLEAAVDAKLQEFIEAMPRAEVATDDGQNKIQAKEDELSSDPALGAKREERQAASERFETYLAKYPSADDDELGVDQTHGYVWFYRRR